MKKTSRTFKRFAAITSASLLAACMVAPMYSFAADDAPTTSITITDSQTNASKSYKAYQLLTASVDTTGEEHAYTYAVNPTFRPILKEIAGVSEEETDNAKIDEAILTYIEGLDSTTGTAAGEMRTFADAVYNKILENDIQTETTTTTGNFTGIAQGYYLIAQDTVTGQVDTTSSLVMVDTAGDTTLTVTVKKDYPKFDKLIGDICDDAEEIPSEWDASIYDWRTDADHDKCKLDAVPFRLVATLPSDYASYNHYTLSFHDDLQKDVFGNYTIKDVYIADASGKKLKSLASNDYNFKKECTANHSTHGDGCDFVLTIEDLKDYEDAVAGGKVIVEYTAPFTANTNLGSQGNWNTGLLEYSNNPYNSGSGEADNTTSTTPEVSVVAFTYEVVINKIKASDKTDLAGAAFKLEKKVNGSYVLVKEFTLEDNLTTFTFSGLDDGTYKLTETKVPAGYNGIDPIEFTVTADHSGQELTELNGTPLVDDAISFTAKIDEDESSLTANVENNSGSELPGTGGIGTTVFYLGGGAMVAVAGIYLISKKRMKNTQE